jgi:nitrogen fixation NifU-like protein
MSWDLRDLYQETILDHQKRPRSKGELGGATHEATGFNPLCGDRVRIQLRIEGDRIKECMFDGEGCAICMSSASMMTEHCQDISVSEAQRLFERMQAFLVAPDVTNDLDIESEELGDLVALGGVRRLPVRIKCANLPWHTLRSAMTGDRIATTEN